MADRIIPARAGLEVFVNKTGAISITQQDANGEADSVVVVDPRDVDSLIGFLKEAKDEARLFQKEEREQPASGK